MCRSSVRRCRCGLCSKQILCVCTWLRLVLLFPPRATSLAVASEVYLVLVSPVTTAGPGSACTPQDWLSDRALCALRALGCQHSIVLWVLVSEQPSGNLTANVSWVTVSFLCYFVFFRANVARIQPWLMFPDTLWCCPELLGFKC